MRELVRLSEPTALKELYITLKDNKIRKVKLSSILDILYELVDSIIITHQGQRCHWGGVI